MHKSKFSGLTWASVTIAYIATYSMTNGFFDPIKNILAPNIPSYVSLMFMPHGVRVLTFYFFGPWGFLYLAPVACLMWILDIYGVQHINLMIPTGVLLSLTSCYVGVGLVEKIVRNTNRADTFSFSWKQLLAAGALASVFNSISLTWLFNSDWNMVHVLGYLFGDVAGQFFMMLIIIVFFKLARSCNGIQ